MPSTGYIATVQQVYGWYFIQCPSQYSEQLNKVWCISNQWTVHSNKLWCIIASLTGPDWAVCAVDASPIQCTYGCNKQFNKLWSISNIYSLQFSLNKLWCIIASLTSLVSPCRGRCCNLLLIFVSNKLFFIQQKLKNIFFGLKVFETRNFKIIWLKANVCWLNADI